MATYNERILAVARNNGYGHDERRLAKGQQLGCDFNGLQERRRSGSTTCCPAGYQVLCSGRENKAARQGLYRLGAAIMASLCNNYVYTHGSNDERLMSLQFEPACKCETVDVVVAPQRVASRTLRRETYYLSNAGGVGGSDSKKSAFICTDIC